ncbi:MAG: hypothetical protein EXR72_26305 [Myxococcales bacterium]|nr:hypothetical protein [Myxococcales bacterium]
MPYRRTLEPISATFLDRARQAARATPPPPEDPERTPSAPGGPALEAVLLAVAAAEAGVNELTYWYNFAAMEKGQKQMVLELHADVATRWSTFFMQVADATNFEGGLFWWDDFRALLDLRNALVNFEPAGKPPNATAYLRRKNLVLAPPAEWVVAVTTPAVARFAVNTVAGMFAVASRLLGELLNDRHVLAVWGTLRFDPL